ncbi:MAG: sulfite oxidase-like oxidoreductase [Pseudomonadota bacterium]|nr:sulfite oxidase-like oxidoreductase [Pseudomonadota bacterium]
MSDDDDGVEATGAVRSKLVETKEHWAREGRLLTGNPSAGRQDRLPPGQRLVTNWPVLDLGVQPQLTPERFRLRVDGLVERDLRVDWAGFMAEPQVSFVSDIHCVTAWSRYDNRWDGVSARHIAERVRPKPEARHVIFHSHDGYTTNVTLEDFLAEGVILAHSWEGKPLSREHGGPMRIVMPHRYFWKSAKWVRRIQFVADDDPGFWETRGYHNEADPWAEERYSD